MARFPQFDLLELLFQDLEESVQELNKGDSSQRQRRNFFRESFSIIEGCVWAWKQVCLDIRIIGDVEYEAAELLMLQDQGFELTEKGRVKIRDDKHVPLKNNIRFTILMLEKLTGKAAAIDFSDRRWDSFQASIKVRHRITHPKSTESLEITDSEFEDLGHAIEWFDTVLNGVSEVMYASYKRQARRRN